MNSLLKFIIENLSFLYGKLGFVFKNSVCDSEDGNGLLELQNNILLIQCIRDRGKISVYLANQQNPKELFELTEIIEITTGQKANYTIPDTEAIHFLKESFNDIVKLLTENFSVALDKRNAIRKEQLYALGYRE